MALLTFGTSKDAHNDALPVISDKKALARCSATHLRRENMAMRFSPMAPAGCDPLHFLSSIFNKLAFIF